MIVVWLFLTMPWVCLQFVIVVFPDHTRLLFLMIYFKRSYNVILTNLTENGNIVFKVLVLESYHLIC